MSVKLSYRLQAICDLVPEGSRICDVGCDHALVDIYLLQEGKIAQALAMDVAKGPLDIARQNLELVGLSDRCKVRQSDGLKNYQPGEADTLIIAGMGGILMQHILEDDAEKARTFHQLILSPQSEPWQVRDWLMRNEIGIREEKLIEEDGKFYPILVCFPGLPSLYPDWEKSAGKLAAQEHAGAAAVLTDPSFQHQAEIDYGPVLLARRDPVLREFLVKKLRSDLAICDALQHNKDSANAARRLQEMQAEAGSLQILIMAMQEA